MSGPDLGSGQKAVGLPAEPASLAFRPAFRLHKTDEYSSVFAFRRSLRGEFFVLSYRPNAGTSARLGLVVAKKLAKRAVERNRVKRQARELFRQLRTGLPPVDVVVRLNARIGEVDNLRLRTDLQQLFARLSKLPALAALRGEQT